MGAARRFLVSRDSPSGRHQALGQQRLVALFVAGWLLLNFPLLALWDRDATLFGLPLFPAALFMLWAGLIAVLAWLMERSAD